MKSISSLRLAAACALALVPGLGLATSFDFEDLPARTTVQTQYGPRGVTFPFGAFIDTDTAARSGTRVLRSSSPTNEFDSGPLVMTFTAPQARVAFYAGHAYPEASTGVLKAYDSAGALVGQDGPKTVTGGSFSTLFEVKTPTAKISKIEFQFGSTEFESIDDLVIEGTAPPPPTTTPPVVTITQPTENAAFDGGRILIQGTVTGADLFPTVTIRIASGLPSDSTAPPANNTVTLSGTGTSRTYLLDWGLGRGPITVTVIAKNSANLEGTATVHFTSLPPAIATRFQASGGAAVFGTLRFAGVDGACVAAIYDNGLIAAEGTATFVVRGAIFTKWLATRQQGSSMSPLGCPTAEERASLGGARAQEFRKGRIYANGGATSYVPGVFRDAIETLGGEASTGIPMADPTDSIGAMQTWLFQRFTRPGQPGQPSTLEIRGSPPKLYVERVGDDLKILQRAGLSLSATTATVWRSFPCSNNLGPCTVTAPTLDAPIAGAGTRFCGGTTYPSIENEWPSIFNNNYEQTPMVGFVTASALSCGDNPLTHDHWQEKSGCSISPSHVFPSDWDIDVAPLYEYRKFLADNHETMELEFEEYYANYFFAGWGWPIRGDLLSAYGRAIIDCGHSPYNSELHPPFILSHMRSETFEGVPSTVAEIWVNGYFPGNPADIEIAPPPRPSPDAILNVVKPVDASSALGLTVQLITGFSGARARFSAPLRQVPVDASGKMNWATGRGYEGEWHVFWTH